jgi:hypothetical protein
MLPQHAVVVPDGDFVARPTGPTGQLVAKLEREEGATWMDRTRRLGVLEQLYSGRGLRQCDVIAGADGQGTDPPRGVTS